MKKYNKGFTLIELLIVIGVIAILAALSFVALNPLARFQDAHNTTRWTDVNALIAAIKLHQIDNQGAYGTEVADLTADLYYQIGQDDAGNCVDTCANPTVVLQAACVDLDGFITDSHMNAVPFDPNATGANDDETRYYMSRNSNGTITVGSCSEELGSNAAIPDISITR